jgi:hypothetical protein
MWFYICIFLRHVVVGFVDLENVVVFTFLSFCDACLIGASIFCFVLVVLCWWFCFGDFLFAIILGYK